MFKRQGYEIIFPEQKPNMDEDEKGKGFVVRGEDLLKENSQCSVFCPAEAVLYGLKEEDAEFSVYSHSGAANQGPQLGGDVWRLFGSRHVWKQAN